VSFPMGLVGRAEEARSSRWARVVHAVTYGQGTECLSQALPPSRHCSPTLGLSPAQWISIALLVGCVMTRRLYSAIPHDAAVTQLLADIAPALERWRAGDDIDFEAAHASGDVRASARRE
jgi:hypothetical protein